jgi:hypothetical protein
VENVRYRAVFGMRLRYGKVQGTEEGRAMLGQKVVAIASDVSETVTHHNNLSRQKHNWR